MAFDSVDKIAVFLECYSKGYIDLTERKLSKLIDSLERFDLIINVTKIALSSPAKPTIFSHYNDETKTYTYEILYGTTIISTNIVFQISLDGSKLEEIDLNKIVYVAKNNKTKMGLSVVVPDDISKMKKLKETINVLLCYVNSIYIETESPTISTFTNIINLYAKYEKIKKTSMIVFPNLLNDVIANCYKDNDVKMLVKVKNMMQSLSIKKDCLNDFSLNLLYPDYTKPAQ